MQQPHELTDLRTALVTARRAKLALQRMVSSLSRAHRLGKADYWDLLNIVPGLDLGKYVHLFSARREARKTGRLIAQLVESLGDLRLAPEIAVRVELEPHVVLGDLFEDFLGDLVVQAHIERSRRRANIALSRLRRVIRALEALRDSPTVDAVADQHAAQGP